MSDEPFDPVTRLGIIAEACQNPRRTRSEITSLVILAKYTNGLTGECWPSYQRIANEIGASRQAVITAIKKLVEDGLITSRSRGPQQSQMFTLVKPTLPVKPTLLVKPTTTGSQAGLHRVVKPTLPEPVIEPVSKPVQWMDGDDTPSPAPTGAAQSCVNLGCDRYPEFWQAFGRRSTVDETEQSISEFIAAGVDLQKIIGGAYRYKNYKTIFPGKGYMSAKSFVSKRRWTEPWDTVKKTGKAKPSKLKEYNDRFKAAVCISNLSKKSNALYQLLEKIEDELVIPHIWPNGKPDGDLEYMESDGTEECKDCFDYHNNGHPTGCSQMVPVNELHKKVGKLALDTDPGNQEGS